METFFSLMLFGLFNLLRPALFASSCSQCDAGVSLEECTCSTGEFAYVRHGRCECERCTDSCSASTHLTQVSNCTVDTNRKCHCEQGFFCNSPLENTCRRTCRPCPRGTFSSRPSLATSCRPHRDCTLLGMVVTAEGTDTQDRVCDYVSTTNKLRTASSTSSTSTTPHAASPTPTPNTASTLVRSASFIDLRTARTVERPEDTAAALQNTAANNAAHPSAHPLAPPEDNPAGHTLSWLLVLLAVLSVVAVLTGCSKWRKGQVLKWKGLAFRKYGVQDCKEGLQSASERGQHVEVQLPLGSEVREGPRGLGPGPCAGGIQQVTMDHSGRGESVNNTVGSIFIYSPGTVILGATSSERKEEASESGEDKPLISAPQQESRSDPAVPEDWVPVGVATQEEDGKELRYPVPASSK